MNPCGIRSRYRGASICLHQNYFVHVISIVHHHRDLIVPAHRTLWGAGLGACTTCRTSGDPAWTCPAALSTYADIGGSDADIVELDGSTGKRRYQSRPIRSSRYPVQHYSGDNMTRCGKPDKRLSLSDCANERCPRLM